MVAHSAGIQDRVGARAVLTRLFCRIDTITKVFVDGGYTGKLIDWAKNMFGYDMEVVKRSEQHKFKVLPKRWIVERTFAWISRNRRLARDFERYARSVAAFIRLAMIRIMLRRLTKPTPCL